MYDNSHLIARADDRALITAVVHRYANLGREEADFERLATFFTPDGTFSLQDGTTWNRNEIHNVLRGEEPAYIRHHVTTMDIEFIDDNNARAETTFFTITDEAAPDHWGCWQDTFQRQVDGSWLMSARLVVADGADPEGWLMRVYTQEAAKQA